MFDITQLYLILGVTVNTIFTLYFYSQNLKNRHQLDWYLLILFYIFKMKCLNRAILYILMSSNNPGIQN